MSLNEFISKDILFTGIYALEMVPKNRVYVCSNRGASGLLLILDGKCEYTFGTESFAAGENSLIYIPEGSNHVYRTISPTMKYIRCDFLVRRLDGNTLCKAVLYDKPTCVCRSLSDEAKALFTRLCSESAHESRNLSLSAALSELICRIADNENHVPYDKKRLDPALTYIRANLSAKMNMATLSGLCNMSESHFRRLFHTTYGTSPTEYITDKRIARAKSLLTSENMRIGEIADLCGFDGIYYFSRVFHSRTGLSPENYRKYRV